VIPCKENQSKVQDMKELKHPNTIVTVIIVTVIPFSDKREKRQRHMGSPISKSQSETKVL
jgi:hypothetical protein